MRKNLQSAAATSRILREIISKPFQNAPICFIILYHFIDLYHIFLVVKDLNFLSLVWDGLTFAFIAIIKFIKFHIIFILAYKFKYHGFPKTSVKLVLSVLKVKHHLAWTIIEWTVFLTLSTFAIYSSEGVLQDYSNRRSSFALDQQPIKQHPTITICFDELSETLYRRMFSLGEDFNVTYITEAGTSLILKDGENVSPSLINETLIVRNHHSCFSITSRMKTEGQLPTGQERTLKVEFGRHLKSSENSGAWERHDSLPPEVLFVASSESVAYGIEDQIIVDGMMYFTEVELNHYANVNFKPKMIKYLREKGCSETSLWKAVEAKMLEEIKENCATVCTTKEFSSSELEKCQTEKQKECSDVVMMKTLSDLVSAGFSPCTTFEYPGIILDYSKIKDFPPLVFHWNKEELEEPTVYVNPQWNGTPTVIMTYKFEKPERVEVYEEYIVASFVDIIGIVGGTLGLYIGFSFFDNTLSFFNYIISFVDMLKGSKLFQKKKQESKGNQGVSQKPENEKGPAANSKNIKDLKGNHGDQKNQKEGNSSNMNKTKEEPVEVMEIQETSNEPTKTTVVV